MNGSKYGFVSDSNDRKNHSYGSLAYTLQQQYWSVNELTASVVSEAVAEDKWMYWQQEKQECALSEFLSASALYLNLEADTGRNVLK